MCGGILTVIKLRVLLIGKRLSASWVVSHAIIHQVKGHFFNLLDGRHLRMIPSDHGSVHLDSFIAGQQLVRAVAQVWVPDLARLILIIGGSQVR